MNLSRELRVTRPTIYKAMERLEIEKKAGNELSLTEWEALKQNLSRTAENNRQRRSDAENIKITSEIANKIVTEASDEDTTDTKSDKSKKQLKISSIDTATMRARLAAAKQEYDYNKMLITTFQGEAAAYYKSQGTTTMMSHNGSMVSIPSIVNLEKYVKLNIAVSKLISDLEGDLDIGDIDDEDPFG